MEKLTMMLNVITTANIVGCGVYLALRFGSIVSQGVSIGIGFGALMTVAVFLHSLKSANGTEAS